MKDNLKQRPTRSSNMVPDLHQVKKTTGIKGGWILIWGMLLLVSTLNVQTAHAVETVPAKAYPGLLRGSIFFEAGDVSNSKVPPSDVMEKVTFYVDRFTTGERVLFQTWLDRAGLLTPLMRDIFREEGLPEDLALLPLIESGFRLDARSPKKALGLWQFTAATGTLCGLRIDKRVDERKDPVKSTRAAARHLKDLYNTFGTWPLALASYNAGSGKVKWALASTGSSDFWELGQSRALTAETRHYVPKFMAAMMIAKNPDAFGFTFSEELSIRYDIVEAPHGMGVAGFDKNAGLGFWSLIRLNPERKRNILPFDRRNYIVHLPEGRQLLRMI